MSAAQSFRRRDANASDAIAAILHPAESDRQRQRRKGGAPKDFERENKLRVKKLQAENRERRRQEASKSEEVFKLTRFKTARSRVFREEVSTQASAPKHPFLRRGGSPPSSSPSTSSSRPRSPSREPSISPPRSRCASADGNPRRESHSRREQRKAAVPSLRELEQREAELAKKTRKQQVDFVNSNAWEVIRTPSKRAEQQQERPKRPGYGHIPRYLLERKEQWAREEEERRRNAPDPDCPPGMALLDEDERVRTLRVLHKSLDEAQVRMNALPLYVETPTQIRRKDALETKLREIEDAIKVFDRAKVYIAIPAAVSPQGRQSRTGSVAA